MGLKNLFKKDYIIGLDIGSTSIKIAQFKEAEGRGFSLVKAQLKEIAPYSDDVSFEREAVLALRYLLRDVNIKRAKIIVSVNCPQTAIKKVVAPYMPKSELRQGIALEAKSYFPFSIDGSMLDFEVLGDIVDKGVRKYDLLAAVCPANTVRKYLSILNKAGVRPSSLIGSAYALGKAAEYINKKEESKCFIDIGRSHTELVIYRGNSLVFTRKIPVSGNDFTMSMTDALVSDRGRTQLAFDEAEKIKKDIGIPSDGDTRIIDNKIPVIQILSMLRPPAEHLVNEISRCFDYYREESNEAKIDSIVLFGGGASLTGLTKFMSGNLGMPVVIGDGLEGLRLEKESVQEREKVSHRLEIAIGAALSNSKGINLLPLEIKEETKRIVKRSTVEAIVTAVIIVSVLFFIGMKIKNNNFNKRISVTKMELASLQPELKKAEARRLAEMALEKEPYWEDVFKELGSIIPGDITIENIKMSNDSILMKGVAASQDGQQILANFIITLEKGLFSDVKLVESKNLPHPPGIEFEIKCWIDYEG